MNCDHREPYGGVAELGISDIEFEKSTSFSCALQSNKSFQKFTNRGILSLDRKHWVHLGLGPVTSFACLVSRRLGLGVVE